MIIFLRLTFGNVTYHLLEALSSTCFWIASSYAWFVIEIILTSPSAPLPKEPVSESLLSFLSVGVDCFSSGTLSSKKSFSLSSADLLLELSESESCLSPSSFLSLSEEAGWYTFLSCGFFFNSSLQ